MTNNGSSRFNTGERGEGGGAGNKSTGHQFIDAQSNNYFLGEDLRIPPFSTLDPVEDLDRFDYQRPETSIPSGRLVISQRESRHKWKFAVTKHQPSLIVMG